MEIYKFTLSLKEQISSKLASPLMLSNIGITSIFEFSFFLRILSISFNCVLLSVKGKKMPENFSLATNSKSELLLIFIYVLFFYDFTDNNFFCFIFLIIWNCRL